ncbi:MAG TPA: ester cyclase [Bacteroidia bacterium]|nr:ester cyclase [Bacteroidia bacterium]
MKKTILAIAMLTSTLGYQNAQAQTSKNNNKPKMENKTIVEQNKQIVTRFNKEFFEKGNMDITKEVFAENFINHSAPPNSPTDVGPMVKFVTALHHGFSNISVDIQEIFGEGDKVCVRKTITATHTGEFMGKQATGKKIVINIIDIEVLKDGKITERWNSTDFPQVLQSL